ncbi:MAG: ArsR family transcriptional regulator [Chitinophagaceae bacterium]|nr:ArsR family transcriptional regulator [Chitinophagaceae bacterium]
MIEALISSKTRIKLLLKFFLNSSNRAYLRGLEEEFGESTNAIRLELNKLEKAGMVSSDVQGNKNFFTANVKHPLFFDLNSIIRKYVGIDTIIENVISQLGEVERVYLSGEFAKGRDNNVIDLELVGTVNTNYLADLIKKAEPLVKRKIRYVIYSAEEFAALKATKNINEKLLIWSR